MCALVREGGVALGGEKRRSDIAGGGGVDGKTYRSTVTKQRVMSRPDDLVRWITLDVWCYKT